MVSGMLGSCKMSNANLNFPRLPTKSHGQLLGNHCRSAAQTCSTRGNVSPLPLHKALTSWPDCALQLLNTLVTRNMRTALSFAGNRIVSAPALSRTAKSQARRFTPIKMSGLQINVRRCHRSDRTHRCLGLMCKAYVLHVSICSCVQVAHLTTGSH
jgi:hypothetical protein